MTKNIVETHNPSTTLLDDTIIEVCLNVVNEKLDNLEQPDASFRAIYLAQDMVDLLMKENNPKVREAALRLVYRAKMKLGC